MDVTISEVGAYHEACRKYRGHANDTLVFSHVAVVSGVFAWRMDIIAGAILAVIAALVAIYSAYKQYVNNKIANRLEPRVQLFIRFYNRAGAGHPILDEVA